MTLPPLTERGAANDDGPPPAARAPGAGNPVRSAKAQAAMAAETAILPDGFDSAPRAGWTPGRIAVVSAIAVGCLGGLLLLRGGRSVQQPAPSAAPVSVEAPPAAPRSRSQLRRPRSGPSCRPAGCRRAGCRCFTDCGADPLLPRRCAEAPPPPVAPPAVAVRKPAALPTAVTSLPPVRPSMPAPPAASSAAVDPAAARASRHERATATNRPIEATDTGLEPPKRPSAPRPREGSEVRMHNGVPLLD